MKTDPRRKEYAAKEYPVKYFIFKGAKTKLHICLNE